MELVSQRLCQISVTNFETISRRCNLKSFATFDVGVTLRRRQHILSVMYKGKLLANNLWIFAFSLLVVIFTRKTRLEF